MPETGIVHLGLGNFHRAHQAVYTALAAADGGSNWSITAVANTNRQMVSALRAQGMRYTVVTIGIDGAADPARADRTP